MTHTEFVSAITRNPVVLSMGNNTHTFDVCATPDGNRVHSAHDNGKRDFGYGEPQTGWDAHQAIGDLIRKGYSIDSDTLRTVRRNRNNRF